MAERGLAELACPSATNKLHPARPQALSSLWKHADPWPLRNLNLLAPPPAHYEKTPSPPTCAPQLAADKGEAARTHPRKPIASLGTQPERVRSPGSAHRGRSPAGKAGHLTRGDAHGARLQLKLTS